MLERAIPTEQSGSPRVCFPVSMDPNLDIATECHKKSKNNSYTRTSEVKKISSSEEKRQVQFTVVKIREYSITLGDHPCAEQFPLSLDWEYTPEKEIRLSDYELTRRRRRSQRRPHHENRGFYGLQSPLIIPGYQQQQTTTMKTQPLTWTQRCVRLKEVTGKTLAEIIKLEVRRKTVFERQQQKEEELNNKNSPSNNHEIKYCERRDELVDGSTESCSDEDDILNDHYHYSDYDVGNASLLDCSNCDDDDDEERYNDNDDGLEYSSSDDDAEDDTNYESEYSAAPSADEFLSSSDAGSTCYHDSHNHPVTTTEHLDESAAFDAPAHYDYLYPVIIETEDFDFWE